NAISQTLVSNSPVNSVHGWTDVSNASIYQAPSGAWVFAAATHQWSWGLTDVPYHFYSPDTRIQRTTQNILDRFVQSSVSPPPSTTTTSTSSPPSTTTTTVPGSPSSYASAVAADAPALDWQTRESSGSVAHDATTNHRDGTYTGGYTLNGAGPILT